MQTTKTGYECKQPWPEDCGVQCGDNGLVLSRKTGDSYNTAFFEAFPNDPACFIRGEGGTVEEAEEKAFEKLLRYQACGHEFERLSDEGMGKCALCGMKSSSALPNIVICCECGQEGAVFPNPLNKEADKKNELACLPCSVKVLSPRYLKIPVESIMPEGLASDREEAKEWYSAIFTERVSAMLLPALYRHEAFLALSSKDQESALFRLNMQAYSQANMIMRRLVGTMLAMETDGVQYLDEGAYFEVCCRNDIVRSYSEYGSNLWLYSQAKDDETKAAFERSIGDVLHFVSKYLLEYLEACTAQPPEGWEKRERILSEEEFKSSLENGLKALMGALEK